MNTVDAALPGIVLRKVPLRIVPFICLLYIYNLLDRSNPGFARLTMPGDMKMGEAEFDLCFGLFYFGYLVFEVPSNLLMRRMGAAGGGSPESLSPGGLSVVPPSS